MTLYVDNYLHAHVKSFERSCAVMLRIKTRTTFLIGNSLLEGLLTSNSVLTSSCEFISIILEDAKNTTEADALIAPATLLDILLGIHLLLGTIAEHLSVPMVPILSNSQGVLTAPISTSAAASLAVFSRDKLNASNVHIPKDSQAFLRLVSCSSSSSLIRNT